MLRSFFRSEFRSDSRAPDLDDDFHTASNVVSLRPRKTLEDVKLCDGTVIAADAAQEIVLAIADEYEERRRLDQERHVISERISAMFRVDQG